MSVCLPLPTLAAIVGDGVGVAFHSPTPFVKLETSARIAHVYRDDGIGGSARSLSWHFARPEDEVRFRARDQAKTSHET